VFDPGCELEKGSNKLKKITSSRDNPVTAPISNFSSAFLEFFLLKKFSIISMNDIQCSLSSQHFQQAEFC
jgi:hypothetical protein